MSRTTISRSTILRRIQNQSGLSFKTLPSANKKQTVRLVRSNLERLIPPGILNAKGKIKSEMLLPFAQLHSEVFCSLETMKLSPEEIAAKMVETGIAEEPSKPSELNSVAYRGLVWSQMQEIEHSDSIRMANRKERKLKALQEFLNRINNVEANDNDRAAVIAECISVALGHSGVRGYKVDIKEGSWLEIVSRGEEGTSRFADNSRVPDENTEKAFINRLLQGKLSAKVLEEDQKKGLYKYEKNGSWESVSIGDRSVAYFVDKDQVERDEKGDKSQNREGYGKGMTREVYYLILRDTNGNEDNVEVYMITNWSKNKERKKVIPLFDSREDVKLLHTLASALAVARKNKILLSQVEKLSVTDELTGLFNRRYFNEKIIKEVSRAKRYERPLSFAMLDIDLFKNINDTYGHPFGDVVLKKVAQILKESFRSTDVVARVGGEEFAVIMPEVDHEGKTAYEKMEQIRKKIEELRFSFGDKEISVTISIGISFLKEGCSADNIIEQADKALYDAKRAGRNRVVLNKE